MICNNCKNNVDSNDKYCAYCGADLHIKQNDEPSMVYHYIYSVMCFSLALSSFSFIPTMSIMGEYPNKFSISLIISLLFIASGIFLLLKKKIGYILARISNVIECLYGLGVSSFGIYMLHLAIVGSGEYDGMGYIFGPACIIGGLPMIAIGIVTFIYYSKRKHMFS